MRKENERNKNVEWLKMVREERIYVADNLWTGKAWNTAAAEMNTHI